LLLAWQDAVLGHPFWGAFMLPWSHGFWDRWGHRSAAASRVQGAYLAGWAGREGVARYRPMFARSSALRPLRRPAARARGLPRRLGGPRGRRALSDDVRALSRTGPAAPRGDLVARRAPASPDQPRDRRARAVLPAARAGGEPRRLGRAALLD